MGNPDQPLVCIVKNCHEPATWMRYTFLNGDHPFCADHAKEEGNFEIQTDRSTYEWYELSIEGGSDSERASFVPRPSVMKLLRDTL